jgi:transposase-like protein
LVRRGDRSQRQIAADLGIPDQTLNNWLKAESRAKVLAKDPNALTETELAELKRLRKENADLKTDREILYKGGSFFRQGDGPLSRYRFVSAHRNQYSVIVEQTLHRVDMATDSEAIIREVGWASRTMREAYVDVIRVMLTTSPHNEEVAEQERSATSVYRAALHAIGERLVGLGDLRSGMETGEVVDILWFFFGYSSYFTLHDENQWSYERAEGWLADQAVAALLRG